MILREDILAELEKELGDLLADAPADLSESTLKDIKAESIGYAEHVSTIRHCQPVRLRTDFPDTPKSRRIYLKSRNLNASDAAVFEFILSKTMNADGHIAAAELSHNQIVAATGISRSTVIRSIKRLADLKLIETVKDAEWHRGRSNRVAIAASWLVPI